MGDGGSNAWRRINSAAFPVCSALGDGDFRANGSTGHVIRTPGGRGGGGRGRGGMQLTECNMNRIQVHNCLP